MASDGNLDLSIQVGQSSFSASGDVQVVLDAYEDFKRLIATAPPTPPAAPFGPAPMAAARETPADTSPNDDVPKRTTTLPLKPYLEQFTLPGNKQKATAILAWSAEKGEKAELTPGEVEKLWKKTPFKSPGNLTRDLRAAETEGWLDSSGKAGSSDATFTINGYGEGTLSGWLKVGEKD